MDGTWPLCGRLFFAATLFGFLGLLTRLRQPVTRALDAGDQAGCDPRVARRRIQFVVTQQCLDDSDISVVFEQVGREAVPQRMQRYVLLDPGCVGCLVEQAAQLAGSHRFAGLTAGKQPALLQRHARVPTRWAYLPPLSNRSSILGD